MQAIQALEAGGNLTEGAQLLIDAVDASTEPLYVQIWGGANTLATALWYINRTRPADIPSFTSKIRVYSISDQDDTGPWVRHYFPSMRWIASRHGFNQYPVATWTGISSAIVDVGGPNQDIVSQAWLTENIQQAGQLGSHYPDIAFIMEGDTPAQFFNYKTGLSNAEYPSWGGWGGRYTANPFSDYAQYSDATDTVLRINGRNFTTNHATIWRWRDAFQHEFAARMQWTLAPNGPDSNATHPPIIVLNGSCTQDAIDMSVSVGDTITLDASSTYSPDASASLTFHWFQYLEPSTWEQSVRWIPNLNFQPSDAGRVVQFEIPQPVGGVCVDPKDGSRVGSGAYSLFRVCPVMHVLLEVKDEAAKNPMTRYRRVLLRMRAYDNGTVVGG
ncbi:hypothetical protein P154DRAFT_519631 [Amniculicola lignicola CBS 123094]|uniref:DUF1593-domain-containing protein n=1 Tax=Amniculicola lignicola CBS 123094 TaxID=1392246 RepID=A0A6A5X1G8_9PLEO|nr:hypothetical protein P154DRAFT_519631 [Amniculicola lignicola CBS 123094]